MRRGWLELPRENWLEGPGKPLFREKLACKRFKPYRVCVTCIEVRNDGRPGAGLT
jgi:hypothetical protein